MSWVEASRGGSWQLIPQIHCEGTVMADWHGFGSLRGRGSRLLDHPAHIHQEFPGEGDGLRCLSRPYPT